PGAAYGWRLDIGAEDFGGDAVGYGYVSLSGTDDRLTSSVKLPFRDAPFRDAPLRDAPFRDAPFRDAPLRDAPLRDAPFRDASQFTRVDRPRPAMVRPT